MKAVYLKNFRRGLATNSSSTHSLIYRNDGEVFKDLDIFELNYYGRCDSTIAASKEAKIKYVLAAIMYNEPLVRIMSEIYPEMKQYFPLIKEEMQDDEAGYGDGKFGMYCRGRLSFQNNLEASVDYLKNVIEDPDIIIVGGSDEMDFVYDTIEGHDECPDPDMVEYGSRYNDMGVTKNGNYWVGYGDTNDHILVADPDNEDDYYYDRKHIRNSCCGKIRFATEKDQDLIPEFPELIDLKITNKCNHGCKFCFMDSNMKGKDADINFLRSVITRLGDVNKTRRNRVEFSIGGGSVILYPHLEELVKEIRKNGHIANVTINAKDCETIIKDANLKRIFMNYIDGIGVSVTSLEDLETMIGFYNQINANKNSWERSRKYMCVHLIPEYLGVDLTRQILDRIKESGTWLPVLVLGYKTNGRGANCEHTTFTDKDLTKLFKDTYSVSIDTTFANRYFDWIKNNFSYKMTLTLNEGEYSMYIDGVEEKAYKSSYQLDKPYNMHIDYNKKNEEPWYRVEEAFREIRKDGGFKVYKDNEKHYWDDAKHYWEE